MPPKKRAAKEKGKGGEAKKKTTNLVPDEPEEKPSREEEEGAETQPEQPEQDHEPETEDEDEDPALQRIVEFYEAHPYFYNLRHEKYRNIKVKEAELAELAKEIQWTVEKIKRRFKNLRSAYGKLKNRAGSAGKSGQAFCRLTSRQEWKLRNLAFLDEVIQPRTQGQEFGRVASEDEDEDDVEAREDFVAPDDEDEDRGTEGRKRGSSADSQDSASKRNRNRNRAGTSTSTSTSISRKKGAKSTPDVGEILTEMLLENRRRDRETEKKLEESATRQPDEREAWGSWLQTVVRNCPKEKFRQFQTETLALSQRYQPTD